MPKCRGISTNRKQRRGEVRFVTGEPHALFAEGETPFDNTLAFMDQASYLWVRASGHVHGIESTWVYRRDVDIDGLRRVHDNLGHGLLGRRVEPSPLPFGRHRWVASHELPGIDVVPARPRAALNDWVDERAQIPVDPEFGPTWHLGVLPVQSLRNRSQFGRFAHGGGRARNVSCNSRSGQGRAALLRLPPPRSRPRRRALNEDARQAARGVPDMVRAVGAMVKVEIRDLPSVGRPGARQKGVGVTDEIDRPVVVPTASVYIDLAEWDSRAELLNGTSNAPCRRVCREACFQARAAAGHRWFGHPVISRQ